MENIKNLFVVIFFIILLGICTHLAIKYFEKRRNLELVESVTSLEIYDIRNIKVAKLVNWKPINCLTIKKRADVEVFMDAFKQLQPGEVDKSEKIHVERLTTIYTDYGAYNYLTTVYADSPNDLAVTPDIYKVKRHSGYDLSFSGKEAILKDQASWFIDLLRANECI